MQNSSVSSNSLEGRVNLIQFIEYYTRRYAGKTYLYEKVGDEWEQTSYEQTRIEAHAIGAGLIELGVEKGDRIAMLSEGRRSWILSEMGLLYAGAVNVPLSVKLDQKSDLLFRITHSEAKYVMVSKGQLSKIRAIRSQCPDLKKVIVFDHIENLEEGEIFIGDVYAKGLEAMEICPEKLEKRMASVLPDDYATISYTSGTVANPKGVLLTHRNYTANIEQVRNVLDFPDNGKMLLILPLDHCFAHVGGMYLCMNTGCSIGTVPGNSLRNIPLAIAELKPDIMLSVPTITKNFRKNIEAYVRDQGHLRNVLFHKYLDMAYSYYREGYNAEKIRQGWKRPFLRTADRLFFKDIREKFFGGNLKFFVSGAAYLDIDQQRFFYAIGVPIMQGYGLSEATPIVSTNDIGRKHVLGTCGMTVRPMQIQIRDEEGRVLPNGMKGEICIKGENVMAGYWKNPEATAQAIENGWLHTGDMGYMWDDDFLCVTGRFKSLLISADGEKYSPEQIEEVISTNSKYIDQILLYNSQSPYTIAFVVPNKDNLCAYLAKLHRRVDPASEQGKKLMLEKIQGVFDSYRSGQINFGAFPERWLPAATIILKDHFSDRNGQMNSSGKVVRHKVEEAYKDRMDYAFTPEGKPIVNPKNMENI